MGSGINGLPAAQWFAVFHAAAASLGVPDVTQPQTPFLPVVVFKGANSVQMGPDGEWG